MNDRANMIFGSIAFNNNMQPRNYSPFIVWLAAASFGPSPGAIPGAALDTSPGVFPVVAPKLNS